MTEIRIAQYFDLVDSANNRYTFQNYYVRQAIALAGIQYEFAPFRAEGGVSSVGGDNAAIRVLFPSVDYSIRLVERADGNRLSKLTLTSQWLNAAGNQIRLYEERYIGIGASFSETTVELRYRSAMDSVQRTFPNRKLTQSLVGSLPLNEQLNLQ
jgi:hypothetical protein